MFALQYIILGLDIISITGLIVYAVFLYNTNKNYQTLKTNLQDSIEQLILDRIELEEKINKKQDKKIDYPPINLN